MREVRRRTLINEYRYEDIAVGHQEHFEITVTEKMMEAFSDITGDINPLHLDEEYARANRFDGRVVYGMLTASLLSTLAGVYLPGRYSLVQRVETDFPSPVYLRDSLTVTGVVTDKSDLFRTIDVKVTVTNAARKKVCRGKMRIGLLA